MPFNSNFRTCTSHLGILYGRPKQISMECLIDYGCSRNLSLMIKRNNHYDSPCIICVT